MLARRLRDRRRAARDVERPLRDDDVIVHGDERVRACGVVVRGSDGLTGTVGAKASYKYERFIFSVDVSGTWADDKHMESYFGVTGAQSANSGLAQYDAKAGVKRVDVKGSITYMMTENWLVTGAAGAGFLMDDAKDSPIVKDDVQPFAMLGVSYRF